ncbi:MAG: GAF domain-containing sensor histidine kinase [Archangium sp.]|nr:GAF domain-containing sensor histidine kinase [Archangium sp.]MDP3573547.1 GAF domain-containing sensor histidine kinase [Archangium sp.]
MSSDSAVTQRAFLTGARLKISRLQLDGDLDDLYRQVAEISSQALNVERVGVWFFDPGFTSLSCKLLHDVKGDGAPPPLLMSKHPGYLTAIREHRFVAVDDARTASPTKELLDYLETWNVTSMLDAAVYRNGAMVGIVCHEHVGPKRSWKREECQFAATVADLLSHFIEVNDRLAAEALTHALELKLKDAHRLDALGRMAAGVAHDLNNLLGVITSGLLVLQRGGGLDVIAPMEESARHAAALVAQLMSLGRKKTPAAMQQPLEPVMAELEKLVAAQTKPGWRVVFDVETGLQIWADTGQLHQVLLNLVLNGMQAMPSGGVVVVRANRKNGGIHFAVIDGGVGIPEENLEKLFDPFYTTRADGHGIGLAVVQQLVSQHGGELSVSSAPGDGSTFEVWWPESVPG